MPKPLRVAITGFGVFSPIGNNPSAILAALREGRSGIGPVTSFPTQHLHSKLAGEVKDLAFHHDLAESEAHTSDRTSQMAVASARQAWKSSIACSAIPYAAGRMGLCVGASGAGLSHGSVDNVFRLSCQPQEQATAVASALGIAGPVVMFTSASAGSGLALVHAVNLLRTGHCDLVVAGGGECLSQVNHESMDSMRLCSVGPCSPFSGEPGITVGEGSAFFILERLDDAHARGAAVQAEIFGFGVTQDAHDVVGGDPSGEGLAYAFLSALLSSGEEAGTIDWIRANGSSNRDQDAAETLAIKQVFPLPPPVAALESFVGHANGAAPAIGLGLALVAFQSHLLPPTLNFTTPRIGCDLDYVPNQARPLNASRVLTSSVGFGGSNVSLLFGTPGQARLSDEPTPELCITGVGVISPFGEGFQHLIDGLRSGASAIKAAHRWHCCKEEAVTAGLADEPKDRRFSSRFTLLQRFALAAAAEALTSAQISPGTLDARRFGVFVGLSRGSAEARRRYASALSNSVARKSIGKLVLRMARFTVASAVSQAFNLKGYGATISEGFGAGLHALAHACIHLKSSAAEQAMLVIAADESGPGRASSLKEMKWLAAGNDGCYLRPYDSRSQGTTLGEGAVALIVERVSSADKRGAKILAHVEGVGLSASQHECQLGEAIRMAITKARATPEEIAAAYGNGSGIWPIDQAEMTALRRSLSPQASIGCVNAGLGFAESASGLFHVAAAVHGLNKGEFFPIRRDAETYQVKHGSFPRVLLTSLTEARRNAAVVLGL